MLFENFPRGTASQLQGSAGTDRPEDPGAGGLGRKNWLHTRHNPSQLLMCQI